MAEKRLIDANAMRDDWLENGENEYVYDTNAVLDSIDSQPTVDAVEVVRCKDCKYADTERKNATEKRYFKSILFCRNFCGDEPLAMWPEDFCSYGERKDGNNDT